MVTNVPGGSQPSAAELGPTAGALILELKRELARIPNVHGVQLTFDDVRVADVPPEVYVRVLYDPELDEAPATQP